MRVPTEHGVEDTVKTKNLPMTLRFMRKGREEVKVSWSLRMFYLADTTSYLVLFWKKRKKGRAICISLRSLEYASSFIPMHPGKRLPSRILRDRLISVQLSLLSGPVA